MASATDKIIKTAEISVDNNAQIKKKLNEHSLISSDAMKKRHDIENNLESLKKAAMPDVKHMQDALSYIGKKLGLSDEFEKSDRFYFYRNGIKSDGRMAEKVKDDYDGNFKKLKDITGGTFVVREGEAKSVFEQVVNSGDLDIENTKAPKSTEGYFDYKINYLLPNGTIGELIIIDGYMYYMKSTIGHELYDITREIDSANIKEKKGEIKISNEQKKFLKDINYELIKISNEIYSDKNWSFENISKALSDDIPKLLSGSALVSGLTTKLSENLSRDKITGLKSALEKANNSRSLLSSKSQTRNESKASNSDLSNIKSSNAIVSDKVTPENTKEVASKVADAIAKKSESKKESKTIRIEEKAQNLDVNKIEQDKKQSKSGNLMDIDATRNFDSNEINRRENDFNRYIIREVDKDSPQINFIKNGFLKPSANLDKLLAVVSQLAYNGKVISNRDIDIFRTSGGGLAIRMNAVLDSNGEEIRAKSESSAPWIYIPGQPTGNYVDMTTAKAFASSSDTNTVRGTAIAFAINRDRNSLIEKINDMNTPDSILKRTDDKLKKERKSATTAVADTASSEEVDTLDYYYEPDKADKSKLKNKRVERISIKSKEVADLKKELNDNRKNIYGFDFGDSYSYMFNENDFYKFQSTPVAKAINLLANTDAFNSDNIEVYGDDQGNIIIKSNIELRTADTDEMETVSRKLDNPKYTFIPATQYEGLGQMTDIASLYEDNDLEMPYIKRFNEKEDPKHENPIIENFFNDVDGDYEFNVEVSNKYEYYPGIIAEGYSPTGDNTKFFNTAYMYLNELGTSSRNVVLSAVNELYRISNETTALVDSGMSLGRKSNTDNSFISYDNKVTYKPRYDAKGNLSFDVYNVDGTKLGNNSQMNEKSLNQLAKQLTKEVKNSSPRQEYKFKSEVIGDSVELVGYGEEFKGYVDAYLSDNSGKAAQSFNSINEMYKATHEGEGLKTVVVPGAIGPEVKIIIDKESK